MATARPADRAPAASFHRGSVLGKCWPMSPAPAAPSSASDERWQTTSPSEWPSGPLSNGNTTPATPAAGRRPAGAGRSPCRRAAPARTLRARGVEVVLVVIFTFRSSPRTISTGSPSRSASMASSVASTPCARAPRLLQDVAAKSLRRLREPDVLPRDRLVHNDARPAATRLTVSFACIAGTAAPVRDAAVITRSIERAIGERPRGVVHEDDSAAPGSAASPAVTESCRLRAAGRESARARRPSNEGRAGRTAGRAAAPRPSPQRSDAGRTPRRCAGASYDRRDREAAWEPNRPAARRDRPRR